MISPELKRVTWLAIATCGVGALGFFVSTPANSQPVSLVFRPFTAARTELHFVEAEPAPRSATYFTFARTSDGSHADTFTIAAPDGSADRMTEITDFAQGRYMVLEPFTRSVTTFYIRPDDVTRQRLAEKACETSTTRKSSEHAMLLGYGAVRRTGNTKDDKSESWVAPALDCYTLRESIAYAGARNESTVTSIVEGPPSESLFIVPSGYTERSPVQVEEAYTTRFPGHTYLGNRVQMIEERYQSSRRH